MKSLFILTGFILFVASCSTSSSESNIKLGKNYGPVEVDTTGALTVEEMLKKFDSNSQDMEFTFVAPIEEVCSNAGCWINIDKGNGEKFMVRFKDHFTIPTNTKIGTEAYIHGVAYWDTVSVELLQHFAEDAGKSPEEIAKITKPKYEMGFEADGIVLKKQ